MRNVDLGAGRAAEDLEGVVGAGEDDEAEDVDGDADAVAPTLDGAAFPLADFQLAAEHAGLLGGESEAHSGDGEGDERKDDVDGDASSPAGGEHPPAPWSARVLSENASFVVVLPVVGCIAVAVEIGSHGSVVPGSVLVLRVLGAPAQLSLAGQRLGRLAAHEVDDIIGNNIGFKDAGDGTVEAPADGAEDGRPSWVAGGILGGPDGVEGPVAGSA